MRNILPRLKHLLGILLGAPDPVPVKELAEQLRVSRRTVFRELENIDTLLSPYGLGIGTRPGEGILLEGAARGKENLKSDLDDAGGSDPADRLERHIRLALALLENPEQQKLFYYADKFKVSAATISHDLDEIEPRLAEYDLAARRRPGYGISLEGGESAFRRAFIGVVQRYRGLGKSGLDFPDPEIVAGVGDLARDLAEPCARMTPQSRETVDLYLMIAAQRVMTGHPLEPSGDNPAFAALAGKLADSLEKQFDIALDAVERGFLAVVLSACRSNKPDDDPGGQPEYRLLRLAYRMIERFDSVLSPTLKFDEQLIHGLVSHLRSAMTRLERRLDMTDPMADEIARDYPEVLAKCRNAAEALRPVGGWLPESEITFLAAHFGAAMLRLSERGLLKKTLRLGIVCIHGIGTSYLLASRVRRDFGSEAEIEIGAWGDSGAWTNFDLLISTAPILDTDKPVVVVSPLPGADDIQRIREEVDRLSRGRPAPTPTPGAAPFGDLCERLSGLAADAGQLVAGFDAMAIPAGCDFRALAKMAGYRFGDTRSEGMEIFEKLMEREALSTQIIPELELVLLHCRTGGVAYPVFALINPEGGRFADPYFKQMRACVVMLMPVNSPPARGELMGSLSEGLLKEPDFLDAAHAGDRDRTALHLEAILRGFLLNFVNQKMKG